MNYELLGLLLLISFVSADCHANWDYCGTFNLPNVNTGYSTSGTLQYSTIYQISLDTISKNIVGENYALTNYSNVFVNVTNITSGWRLYGLDPGNGIKFLTNNSNNTNQVTSSYATICLNGTSYTNNLPIYTDPFCLPENFCGGHRYASLNDFTAYYRRLWTFRDDATNNIYSFVGQNATLTAWCDDYSQIVVNLTSAVGATGNITIQTLEQPKFFLQINNLLPRIRQDSIHFLADNYYVPTLDGVNYTFTMVDYTGGQCYKSYLTINENINDTLGNVHVQQFDQSNLQSVNLRPNIQYNFKVNCNTSYRDLGSVYLDATNLNRNVIISQPTLSPLTSRWDGLNISISNSYDSKTVSCTVKSVSLTDASFVLYSTNTTPYTLIGVSNSTSILSTVLTQSANTSMQYYAVCFTSDSMYGVRQRSDLINFQNNSAYYGGFGNLQIPSSILGVSKNKFLNIGSVAIALVVGGLFSAVSMGTGAIVFGITIGLFYFIGYFITSPMTIGLIIFLGIMIKMSENRFGVVT